MSADEPRSVIRGRECANSKANAASISACHIREAMVAAAIMLAMMMVVEPAFATAPGENGRSAFRRYFNNAQTRGAIFMIRPDGTGLIQVTHRGRSHMTTNQFGPRMAGGIAFQRVESGKPSRIFKIRPNGTHLTLLSLDPNAGEEQYPGWSPSGKRIVFQRFNDDTGLDALFVMRADGTHAREVQGTDAFKALGIGAMVPRCDSLVVQRKDQEGLGSLHHPPGWKPPPACDPLETRGGVIRLVSRRAVALGRIPHRHRRATQCLPRTPQRHGSSRGDPHLQRS